MLEVPLPEKIKQEQEGSQSTDDESKRSSNPEGIIEEIPALEMFEFAEKLGGGASGDVYRVKDKKTGMEYAAKVDNG